MFQIVILIVFNDLSLLMSIKFSFTAYYIDFQNSLREARNFELFEQFFEQISYFC